MNGLKVYRFILSPTVTEYYVIGKKNKKYIDEKGCNLKIKGISQQKAESVQKEYSVFSTEKFIQILDNLLQPTLF